MIAIWSDEAFKYVMQYKGVTVGYTRDDLDIILFAHCYLKNIKEAV